MAQKKLLLLELYKDYSKRPSDVLFENAGLDSYTKDIIDLSYMSAPPGKVCVCQEMRDILSGNRSASVPSGVHVDLPPEPDIDPKYFKGAKWAHPSWK